jgi:hypothetical protein
VATDLNGRVPGHPGDRFGCRHAPRHALIEDLAGALVSNSTPCILDVSGATGGGSDLPDGPFPARTFVPSAAACHGEIIIWVTKGHLSGLEYAWTSEEPPARWPLPNEMQVAHR